MDKKIRTILMNINNHTPYVIPDKEIREYFDYTIEFCSTCDRDMQFGIQTNQCVLCGSDNPFGLEEDHTIGEWDEYFALNRKTARLCRLIKKNEFITRDIRNKLCHT